MREKLIELLAKYFDIGDSYAYNLTRVKTAFAVGTMSLEDFEEFDEETIADLASYLVENGVVIAGEVVSKEIYKQIRWERDVALKQLERIGVSLGEKTDNIVSVVRCSECKHRGEDGDICYYHSSFGDDKICYTYPDGYCSDGEPKEKGEE